MPRMPHPAPAITGDVCRVTTLVIADSEQCLFSMDYMAAGFSASPAVDLAGLVTAFATGFAPGIKALLPIDAMLNGFQGTFLSRNDIAGVFSTSGNGPGTAGANHLDKMMAVRIQKLTTLKGAHGRGGLSFGPVYTGHVTPATDANRLNPAAVTAYQAFATALQNALPIASGSFTTFTPCVSTRPPLGTSITQFAMIVTKMTVDAVLGTVRRRKLGRGI
ncbi:MAG: hypothetical protein HRJ53_19725 [Acidobacteria bacterium Pan2503]|uniref:Uncharacterized protein n=1 Tax=Candidatus Acidiferrum panamense TaxID=2741543 RepID=A0A7V8NTF8_9BACT|nr:hypothetical protein [Candidatus Acidoferrum panamensis]